MIAKAVHGRVRVTGNHSTVKDKSDQNEEDAFNEWVGKNIIASGDLPPETLTQLRERFEKERQ
jgi:hypothetical protein